MIEPTRIDRYIYGKLKADTTLTALIGGATDPRIYNTIAPPDADAPMVVFALLSNRDVREVGQTRIMVEALYTVRGIAADVGSYLGTLESIADRIDTVLHRSSGAVTGANVFAVTREESVQFTEAEGGKRYRHAGGLFRVLAQAA